MSGGAGRTVRRLRIPGRVAAVLRSLHPHIRRKIRASLQAIMDDPSAGKALTEELSGFRSYRVSRYRIVYRMGPGQQIEVVAVGPRERIYEDTYMIIRKERTPRQE